MKQIEMCHEAESRELEVNLDADFYKMFLYANELARGYQSI